MTHQSEEQKADKEDPTRDSLAIDVTIPNCTHGDHEKVVALKVGHWIGVDKFTTISLVLQLVTEIRAF